MQESSLHGFVGQKKIVNHVLEQLKGAQALGQAGPHLLVLGPSGMGKTRLVKALALEMGGDCRIIHGKAGVKDICEEAATLAPGDFLFLDEAHTLPREAQEALYELIDVGLLSPTARTQLPQGTSTTPEGKMVLPKITVALATNQPSLLLEALHRRMDLTVYLRAYNSKELLTIASETATSLEVLCQPEALEKVVKASQGQPRRIVQIIKGVKRQFYTVKKELTKKEVLLYLKSNGQNGLGLDREQRNYLKELRKFGRASIETLSGQLGLERNYVTDKIEPGLLRLGLLRKGMGGRELTDKGRIATDPPPLTMLGFSLSCLTQWAASQKIGFQVFWNTMLRMGLREKVKNQTEMAKLRAVLWGEYDIMSETKVSLPNDVVKKIRQELEKKTED